VHLNVTVRGGHCRPVRDLEQPDFSVAEDGVSGVVRDARLIKSARSGQAACAAGRRSFLRKPALTLLRCGSYFAPQRTVTRANTGPRGFAHGAG
jgi:hypothetical protein